MRDEVISAMQKDMQIKRYDGESEKNYIGRLVYSALCDWTRYSILDEVTPNSGTKSKKYIYSRMQNILENLIRAFPICREWIYADRNGSVEIGDIVRMLRNKMLIAGELVEVDDKGNLGLPERKMVECAPGYARVIGISSERGRSKYVGITKVQKLSDISNAVVDNNVNNVEMDVFIRWLCNYMEWSEYRNVGDFEFFNPYSKHSPSSSWTSSVPQGQEILLAREPLYNGIYEYHLIRYEDGKFRGAVFPEIFDGWKEERRVLLALRDDVGNQMKANYTIKGNVVILNLYCGIPIREQTMIDTYCWPLKSMSDEYNYVVPLFIWPQIKDMLFNNLRIVTEERAL